ncbi:MAG TPA: LysR family transcriptional regulator [Magnetospirillaceae bacterium]|nr:LysR family transcriptional regulator [Magnetospirillaceae bacterium]
MRFDLTDLRLFLQVVDSGSITHGAEKANMALPSASARLRGMEEMIGLPLLDRGRRGVEPTAAGLTLLHHARLVLRQIEAMHGELGEFSAAMRSQVTLLANTAAMTEFLPARLAPYLAAHPGLDIDLKERRSAEIVKAMLAGAADLGIILDSVDYTPLQTRPFAPENLVLVVPKEDPLAARRKLAFTEVAGRDFVGLGPGNPMQDYISLHAQRAGAPLAFRVHLSNFDGLCRLVEAGVGLAVMPERTARTCRRSMKIAIVRLTDDWARRQLLLCCRDFDALPSHARGLAVHLCDRFSHGR